MKTLKEKIEVMQAALDGKEIEFYSLNTEPKKQWEIKHGSAEHLFNWQHFDYRIKPEPMEFWVNVFRARKEEVFIFEDEAKAADKPIDFIKTIKVREVIE